MAIAQGIGQQHQSAPGIQRVSEEDTEDTEDTERGEADPNNGLLTELTAANNRLRLITQITTSVIGASTLQQQVHEIARQARVAFDADTCIIRVLNEDSLQLLACDGVPSRYLQPAIKANWGIAAAIIASRSPLVIGDVRQHPVTSSVVNRLPRSHKFLAYAGAPLLVEDKVVGILGIYAREAEAFTIHDIELLRIVAYHIAVAIANDNLYQQVKQQKEQLEEQIRERARAETALRQSMEQLRSSLEGTVRAMSAVVEMRDPYTAGHQRRVAALTCAIATRLQMSREEIELLRMAGLVHDIGKIAVPAQILCKPTKLLPPEWNIIQTHAEVGYTILKDTAFPPEIALVALQHHERLDGSGYPSQLQGEQIILPAQILAVADVIEAMVSHRPYRAGLPIQTVLEEIIQHRGTRYNADAVDACLQILAEFDYDLTALVAHHSTQTC